MNKITIPQEGVFSQIGVARQSAHANKIKYGFDFFVMKNRLGMYVSNQFQTKDELVYSTQNPSAA